MVKNHALKNTARARKAVTGEAFPEAMRNSALSAAAILKENRLPVIHLGNSVFHDMNAENPSLSINGESGTVRTLMVKHILSELIKSEAACRVIVITGKDGEYKSLVESASGASGLPQFSLVQTSLRGDRSAVETMLEELAAKAKDDSNTEYRETPLIVVVDEISDVPNESMVMLQTISEHGFKRGIYTIVTSHDATSNAENTIRFWSGGYAQYGGRRFSFGASEKYDPTFMIGSEVLTDDDLRNCLIVGDNEEDKSKLARNIAHQALDKGWAVVVLAGERQFADWEVGFGNSVELWKMKYVDIMIDSCTRRRSSLDAALGKGEEFTRCVLIVDGYFETEKATAQERLGEVALINFVRGGNMFYYHFPMVMTSQKAPWFHDLFSKVALLSQSGTANETRKEMVEMDLEPLSDDQLTSADGFLCSFNNRSAEHVPFSMDGTSR